MNKHKLLTVFLLALSLSWSLKGEAALDPGGTPHYFGPYPNYANSPLPSGSIASITVDAAGSGYTAPSVFISDLYGTGTGATADALLGLNGIITGFTITNPGSGYTAPVVTISDATGTGADATAVLGTITGGIRKFVDKVPDLIFAVPDTTTYAGADYYEIELGEYNVKMHTDLPSTKLRGYRQTNMGGTPFSYLGPVIVAQRDKPVRIKFTNKLAVGMGGDLLIPVDTSVMGSGMGPNGEMYTQNRATLHLHGNNTVWISDGTPHQWTTPAGDGTIYPKGVSVYNVPDMPNPGKSAVQGELTFYYTNAQSARLQFYHDHSYGITRLNVYSGEAAGYVITDQVEQDLINGTNNSGVNPDLLKVLPDVGIPLVIQDRTFVDAATIGYQDPTWNWGTGPRDANGKITSAVTGDLWYPHVYMPNQNPYDPSGMNAFGRWHYGPWFWPPTQNLMTGPVPNTYCLPTPPLATATPQNPGPYDCSQTGEPPFMPGTPNPSTPGEAFMDTPVVNGMAYPYLDVEPRPYRFRILNAANDRFFNLQLYVADPLVATADGRTNTEVKMVPAVATAGFPADWPKDGRDGGVPDPATAGPNFIQIGTEGGFLPAPVVLPNQPVDWNMDQTNFDMGLVNKGALILGTAERADVIIDFTNYAGQTLILYNDAPAPFPALDPRYDYYTGNPDLTDIGGTPSTQPGYGPNTRTIMQIRVGSAVQPTSPVISTANLDPVWKKGTGVSTKRGVFEVSQDEIVVPNDFYNSAYGKTGVGADTFSNDAYARIYSTSMTFQTVGGGAATVNLEPKAIQDEMGEAFDTEFGRMSAMLGLELPFTQAGAQNFILLPYASPPVEIVKNTIFGTPIGGFGDGTQIWKITHNGVDTHTIHTHLYNAQLINRVAWDNARRLPDANELGWKETFRVNPLQDTIIAFRAIAPTYDSTGTAGKNTIPFKVPNSVRLIDPTQPAGSTLGLVAKDPLGNPITVTNQEINFGWEYVYHCHLLAHEEMDMMHSVVLGVAPDAPAGLTVTIKGGSVVLTWTDNSVNETTFTVQRSSDSTTWTTLATISSTTGDTQGSAITYTDKTYKTNVTYYYRVFASNTLGSTQTSGFTASVGGAYPITTVDSGYSNVVGPPTGTTTLVSLTQAATTRSPVVVTWSYAPTGDQTGFTIQRATNSAFTGATTFKVGNVTSYSDSSIKVGVTYYYRVMATNPLGNGSWSASQSILTH